MISSFGGGYFFGLMAERASNNHFRFDEPVSLSSLSRVASVDYSTLIRVVNQEERLNQDFKVIRLDSGLISSICANSILDLIAAAKKDRRILTRRV